MQTLSNPFTPTAHLDPIDAPVTVGPSSDDAIRRELLSHEAWIRSLGRMSSLGLLAVPFLLLAIANIVFSILGLRFSWGSGLSFVELLVLLVASVSGFLGYRMSMLDPRVRLPVAAFQVVGLAGFPVGTLVSVGWLYLLLSEKGRRVMSAEYQGVVARTPHIHCAAPRALRITAMVLCALCVLAVAIALFAT